MSGKGNRMERLISFFGLFVMIGLAWLMSSHKSKVSWRVVVGGVLLQFAFAALILLSPPGKAFFVKVDGVFNALMDCVDAGSRFVFGTKFADHYFAFRVLPSIIFFSALMQVLYYLGVMQVIVRLFGFVVQRTLGTTGPESLAAAANIFLGQTEAPLVVRPYVHSMTRSELMAVMVPGFGSTAGGVLIAFKSMGIDAGHLLTASVLSAPASLLIAKVIIPETEKSKATGDVNLNMGDAGDNVLEAASIGTIDGMKLALNVGAMLISFLALIALADGLLGWVGSWFGMQWSLSAILSRLFAPMAFLMGIEWKDCFRAGELLGVKMVANEFVAYGQLSEWIKPGNQVQLSERSVMILTYALCGFANFSSIGIQIGGIGGMAPERRTDLAKLGLRAMLGGTLACFMTACVVGVLKDSTPIPKDREPPREELEDKVEKLGDRIYRIETWMKSKESPEPGKGEPKKTDSSSHSGNVNRPGSNWANDSSMIWSGRSASTSRMGRSSPNSASTCRQAPQGAWPPAVAMAIARNFRCPAVTAENTADRSAQMVMPYDAFSTFTPRKISPSSAIRAAPT